MAQDNPTRRQVLRSLGMASAASLLITARPALAADKGMADDQQAAEEAVANFLATIQEGFKTRNADLLSSPELYYTTGDETPDHYVLYDVVPPFVDVGTKNLLQKNKDYIASTEGPTIVSWKDKRIQGGGPYAFFHGIMHAQAKYKDGRDMDFSFRHTLIFKKIDGQYLCIHEHASVPYEAMGFETSAGQS